jgi:hypothetical protein
MTPAEFDALYAQRHEAAALSTCEVFLRNQLGTAPDYDWLWRSARLKYFQGMQALDAGNEAGARELYMEAAEQALDADSLQKGNLEATFWAAVCELEAARLSGKLAMARILKDAEKRLEQALYQDETFHHGGPARVLGRIYQLKPLLLGGSLDRAIASYRASLQHAPDNSTTLLYLADALIADRQPGAARQTLYQLIEASPNPDWQWEAARDMREAKEWLTSRFD